ncbi:MAG: YceI family protein [Planctomycetota bacterium]
MKTRTTATLALAITAAGSLALIPTTTPQAVAEAAMNAESFETDTGHSAAIFRIKHLGVTNFYGRFNDLSGTFLLDKASPSDSFLQFEIDVASVDTNSDGRDRHLKGPDFFNAAQFPTATFQSTSISAGSNDGEFEVTGDLTIRGTTKPVSFTAMHTGEGDRGPRFGYRAGFETAFEISRSDFGINYLPEGLGDEVKLIVSVQGVRK